MAASRRVSPAAARPSAPRSAARAPGRRRRPSLWRRALLGLPRPPSLSLPRSGRAARHTEQMAALAHEVHELRLAMAALRAEVSALHARPPVPAAVPAEPVTAAAEPVGATARPSAMTLLMPLARAAKAAGIPAGGVLSLDLGPDTATTEIVLTPPAEVALPEASMLDPRLARVAAALDELMAAEAGDRPVAVGRRESA